MKEITIAGRKYLDFTKIPSVNEEPYLLEVQKASYKWYLEVGMMDLISTVSPIEDVAGHATVELLGYTLGEATNDQDTCRERDLTYQAPLRLLCRLVIKDQETGGILEAKEQEVYLGEFPIMTETATFIVNGAERVLVSQLIRSPGIYFKEEMDASGGSICSARLIPNSGVWVQVEYDAKDILWIRVDKARKLAYTTFLRALGFEFDLEGDMKTMRYEGKDFVVENPVAEDAMGFYTREALEGTRRDTGEIVKIAKAGARLDATAARLVEKCRLPRITLFEKIEPIEIRKTIENTLAKETDDVKTQEDALAKVYERLKQEPYPGRDYAEDFLHSRFFVRKYYDLSPVGRYKMNVKLQVNVPVERPTLMREDFVKILEFLLKMKAKKEGFESDDIDHLSNRRVRGIGELIQNQMRLGYARMERLAKEKMASQDVQTLTPQDVINYRPVQSALNEFFGSNQLSQFMDQTNPLSELTHKRRVSALGPQGLTRERAGFEVRDVHHSHYGRICPIESPEGPNIGLISSLATFARIGAYGFIQTPYRKIKSKIVFRATKSFTAGGKKVQAGEEVDQKFLLEFHEKGVEAFFEHEVTNDVLWLEAFEEEDTREHFIQHKDFNFEHLLGKTVSRTLLDPDSGVTILQKGELINGADVLKLQKLKHIKEIRVVEPVRIVQANARTEDNRFTENRVSVRENHEPVDLHPETVRLQFLDVSAKQIISVTTSLIPFLEHDDANRALMGSNMQRQAVPLITTEAPIVGTGMERKIAIDSGTVVSAKHAGVVEFVNSERVIVRRKDDPEARDEYKLVKWRKSNQGTTINQTPCVSEGDKLKAGDVLADGPSTDNGTLALGKNVLAAFVPWYGYNFEDAIILSERLVKQYTYCSFHIEKSECEARDTKLGPEEITKDIPTVAEEVLKNLDEEGIVRIGVHVKAEDILVGKVIPRGESELSSEEKIIRAIFGDKAKDVRNTSLKVKPGMEGKVIDVKVYSRDKGDDLKPGVNKLVRVFIAQKKNIQVGDKMAGRHGNKGVVSKIVPIEDMPFLEDGTPVDIILNPLGVPSRMNVGQILETQLGLICHRLGFGAITPVFNGATVEEIAELARQGGVSTTGKVKLFDGKSGEVFDGPVLVGMMYMMKLNHLVEDKMHARSTGSYALVTQQPLGGKAQFGGQRLGEMEVWALEAYGAANLLQELLTIKSDDVMGRVKTYEAIVKGKNIQSPGMPESFNVLVKELQALGMKITLFNRFGQEARIVEERDRDVSALARKVGLKGYF